MLAIGHTHIAPLLMVLALRKSTVAEDGEEYSL